MTTLSSQPPVVVYVHGAGNKPPAGDLERAWDLDLFGEELGEQTRMAYYADLLYPEPAAISADACAPQDVIAALVTDARREAARAEPRQVRSLVDRASDEDAERYARLSPEQQQLALQLSMSIAAQAYARLSTPAVVPVALPEPVLALSGTLRQILFRELQRNVLFDAAAYLLGPQGEQIRQRLRQALDAVGGPVIVIGHSLGTVIAYDVLAEAGSADRQVLLLATLGSPLGNPVVQPLVAQPLRVPASVRLWLNVADPFDLVAFDTTLDDEFHGGPGVIDVQVDNPSPNSHAACGYLRQEPVRAAVAAARGGI